MNGKSVAQVPEVPGIDLAYRPRNYFWAADLKVPLPSSIAGESPPATGSRVDGVGRPDSRRA